MSLADDLVQYEPCADPGTSCSFSVISGSPLTLWSGVDTVSKPDMRLQLQLAPEQCAVIGRSDGYPVPYLDPAFRASCIMPGTGEPILCGSRCDQFVSRAHFMLRGGSRCITFVNGVPSLGGGIRPPRNWTQLLQPENRMLLPAEELLLPSGDTLVLRLPNDTVLAIGAE